MKKTVSVAPMMDCTDKHEIYFLSLISKNIHLYSEMIVANAIIRGDRNKLLSFKDVTNPVVLQIGGSNPEELAEACKISEDYGYKEMVFESIILIAKPESRVTSPSPVNFWTSLRIVKRGP